jgi:hypothetical protein
MRRLTWLSLSGWVLAAAGLWGQAPISPEFRLALPGVQKKLQSLDPGERSAAVAELKRFAHPESVKLLQPLVEKDPDVQVRAEAAAALLGYRENAAVLGYMLAAVKREITADNAIFLSALLAADAPATRKETLDAIQRSLKFRPTNSVHVIVALEHLGSRPQPSAVPALCALRSLEAFARELGFRRAVVHALMDARHPDALGTLVELVGTLEGEVAFEVAEYLTRTTGQPHALDGMAWKQWWQGNRGSFQFPPAGSAPRASLVQKEDEPSYYGIPIRARKVVFILDTSGSMQGERLASAKRELIQVLENLPARTQFNIVIFNTQAAVWNKSLVEISDTTRRQACDFVNRLPALGSTNTFEALRLALEQKGGEAIYLLTDGQPTSGAIVDVVGIAQAVRMLNRGRGMSIHTIGIRPGAGSIFDRFLKELAAQNYGQYRAIE